MPKEGVSQEEWDEREAEATTAFDAFKALFADLPGFCDQDAIKESLNKGKSPVDETILRQLCEWTSRSIRHYGEQDSLIEPTADASEELADATAPFIKTCVNLEDDEGRRTPSLWPVVRLVQVGLPSPTLERGIIIADLPGLSDMNRIRTRTTKGYLRACHFCMLVAPIARVKTDNLVHGRLGGYDRMFTHKIGLVCTKIDVSSLGMPYQTSSH